MDGSIHFNEQQKPNTQEKPERRLPEPETINWEELNSILREAEVATERLQAAHETYIAASQAEHKRAPTPEQMQDSDAALAAEQKAYESYTEAATRRKQAMDKADYYVHAVHSAYSRATDLELMLLERRHKLEGKVTGSDGTMQLDVFRQVAEIDLQLSQVQADADAAYLRLQKTIDAYQKTVVSEADEAIAAK